MQVSKIIILIWMARFSNLITNSPGKKIKETTFLKWQLLFKLSPKHSKKISSKKKRIFPE